MASIDDMEAAVQPTPSSPTKENCDPCKVTYREYGPDTKVCFNCCYGGSVDRRHTWTNAMGNEEPMRYCYQFLEFVPSRISFGCTLFEPQAPNGR